MKKATKVFIWIGMVIQCFLVYPIIVGILALRKLDTATSKEDLRRISVLTILFCSFLGGVFMLTMREEDFCETSSNEGNKVIIYKEKQISYEPNPNVDFTKLKAKKIIRRWMRVLALVLAWAAAVLIVAQVYSYEGFGVFSTISACINLIIFIILIVCYWKRRGVLSRFTNKLLITIITISILGIILEILVHGIKEILIFFEEYEDAVLFLFGECFVLLSWAIIGRVLYLSYKSKQADGVEPEMIKNVTCIETSNVEIEIEKLKKLLEKGIITEEEYQKMRKDILNKYYV